MERDSAYSWLVAFGACVVNNLEGSLVSVHGVMYPEYLQYFSLSSAAISLIACVQAAVAGFGGVFTGNIVKRFGSRPMCIISALLISGGLIIGSLSSNIYLLYFANGVITGLGISLSSISVVAILQQYFVRRRALANGLCAFGGGFAYFVWPPLIRYFLDKYGWRGTLLLHAAILLNIIPIALLFSPFRSTSERKVMRIGDVTRNRNDDHRRPVRVCFAKLFSCSSLRKPAFLLFGISLFCFFLALTAVLQFLPMRAMLIGIDRYKAALLISVFGVGSCAARLVMGFAGDLQKFNLLGAHIGSVYATGLLTVLVPFLPGFYVLAIDAVALGFAVGTVIGLLPPVAVQLVGLDDIAPAWGVILAFGGSASLIGPTISGILNDVTGQYYACFLVMGSAAIFGGVLASIVPVVHRCHKKKNRSMTETEEYKIVTQDNNDELSPL